MVSLTSAASGEAAGPSQRVELRAAFAAARTRLLLVTLLFVLAGLAWWFTTLQMAGMDAGPGTDLGPLAWFVGVWILMMAAMMFPSVAPTVALYSRMTRTRHIGRPMAFTAAYLVVWGSVGVLSYGLYEAGRAWFGAALSWDAGGRWFAGAILLLAALYELTPFKDACLRRCRTPLGFLLSTWRDGYRGAAQMGARHAGWCVGCCWALMAALFALGVMSLVWMAFVAAIIALEKTFPSQRAVLVATTATLLVVGVIVLVAPHSLPGLVVPSGMSAMS